MVKIVMAEVKRKRIPRSVNIDEKIYIRIVEMSERLGVNVNAYLLEAIGQKLFKDESLLRIEQAAAESTALALDKMIELVSDSSEKENPSD